MNKKNIGYVSIELVITAALIMAVGFFAILNFNILGNESMTKGMERLDGTGVFSSGETTTPVSSYDSNGYDKSLNINPADINPSTDFEFYLLGMGDGYGISNYINETDKDVIIPKMYNGLQVVEIGWNAFYGRQLTSAALPNSIKLIDGSSFSENQLSSIIIPNSVTTINDSAFAINLLTTVVVPDSVYELGNGIFASNQLATFTLPKEIMIIPWGIFDQNNLTSVSIPESVRMVSGNAFRGNDITSLTLPEGILNIGELAFSENNIVTLTIPSTLQELTDGAFAKNNLTFVEFKGTLPTILLPYDGVSVFKIFAYSDNFWGPNKTEIKVPVGQLEAYKSAAASFGIDELPSSYNLDITAFHE